jgi:hypothetical protein
MLGALVLVSPADAQKGIGAKPAPARRAVSFGMAGGRAFRPAHPSHPMLRGRASGRGWGPGWGYLVYPDYYGYSDYDPVLAGAPPWESAAQFVPPAEPEREIHPIMLEKQGDQWVQITGYSQSPAPPQATPPNTVEATHVRAVMPSHDEPPLPLAILVFRDGHQEEVKSYTIIGNTLYARANYWTDGWWTRKIEIANLDVPATLKLNHERGSKFQLPSGPQEVMVRP